MTVIKKNQLIVLSLAIMIVVAGYLNFTYKSTDPFSQELTGSIGGKLGEATLVQENNDMDIGYAEPVSNVLNNQEEAVSTPKKEDKQSTGQVGKTSTSDQYFSETRAEKERIRGQEVSLHEKVLAISTASKEAQAKAQAGLEAMSQKWEKEMIVERLIKAQGFKDAVVFINEGNVNVVVLNGSQLTRPQVAQIQEIVTREAKVTVDKIKLVAK